MADIRNSIFHLVAAALVLGLLAVVRFWPLLSPIWDYIKTHGDPSLSGLCIGSIVLFVLVIAAVFVRLWSTRKETE